MAHLLEYVTAIVQGTAVNGAAVAGSPIATVVCSSAEVTPGAVFVAVPGTTVDGHRFVDDAFGRGALLAVVSDAAVLRGRPGIVVADTRRALSRLAALTEGFPTERMATVGVTGTNGKTTITWLIHHAFRANRIPSLRIGTLGTMAEGVIERPGNLTTPDPLAIHAACAAAVAGGVHACVMEASSHALDQLRVDDVAFDVGVFTNLTRDHLDYHHTMEAYGAAKWHLFELVAQGKKQIRAAVINQDDALGQTWVRRARDLGLMDLSYGATRGATVRIESFSQQISGSELQLAFRGDRLLIRSPFIGRHNAYNLAAAFATLSAFHLEPSAIVSALSGVPVVPGRLEPVPAPGFGVYVDYAHTPDALQQVLPALREICRGTLWVIFGCGGDRDRGKRPLMATVAAAKADQVVITSDNPRTEDPQAIIDEILSSGIVAAKVALDRREAIAWTLRQAKSGDVVLIAGKGHEDYQILGTKKIHFSDTAVARECLVSV